MIKAKDEILELVGRMLSKQTVIELHLVDDPLAKRAAAEMKMLIMMLEIAAEFIHTDEIVPKWFDWVDHKTRNSDTKH